jgi:hypothetical protein
VNLTNHSGPALTILLAVAVFLPLSVPAVPGAQTPHAGAPAPAETKIASDARIAPVRPGYEFPHGQTLHYEAEWRFLPAGVATVRIDRAGAQEHVSATADSTGVVALLYRVQDQFNSYFDARSLCSSRLVKHTEEGSHRRDTVITYDYARGKAVLEERNLKDDQQKKIENDIPGCVTDVLSGIFYVASLPLQPGANYRFPINNGSKTVTAQAHVEGKEQIKTPAGTFQTVRVGPEGDSGILSGRIWIWFTDDAQHLPVQMRAKLSWGTLNIYLTSISK